MVTEDCHRERSVYKDALLDAKRYGWRTILHENNLQISTAKTDQIYCPQTLSEYEKKYKI